MSEIKRAYDLLRGYVNHEWDRIKGMEWDEAWKELYANTPGPTQVAEDMTTASATSPTTEAQGATRTPTETDLKSQARQILGVTPDDDFETIRKAFERLNKRSHPANFTEGSEEAKSALALRSRVQWAYTVLTSEMTLAEKRFRSLEIE